MAQTNEELNGLISRLTNVNQAATAGSSAVSNNSPSVNPQGTVASGLAPAVSASGQRTDSKSSAEKAQSNLVARYAFDFPASLLEDEAIEVADLDICFFVRGSKDRLASLPISLEAESEHAKIPQTARKIAFSLRVPGLPAIPAMIVGASEHGLKFRRGNEDTRACHVFAAGNRNCQYYLELPPTLPAEITNIPLIEYRYTALVNDCETTKIVAIPCEIPEAMPSSGTRVDLGDSKSNSSNRP